jgi:protein phosphatase
VPLNVKAYGLTDIGLVRKGNEDALHVDENNHVYAVCDGMGGHQAGEVASLLAVETIQQAFDSLAEALESDPLLRLDEDLPNHADILVKAIRLANRAIYTAALNDTGKAGMGTTVVAMAFRDDLAAIAHVGDSRAYRVNNEHLEPLTRDHSWVAEIQESRQLSKEEADSLIGKNIITRALGVRENVEVDVRLMRVKPGDIFMMCSDGLCGYADDEDIFSAIKSVKDNPKKISEMLVKFANERGGADNVTILTLEMEDVEKSESPETDTVTVGAEESDVLTHEDTWLANMESKKKEQAENSVESSDTRKSPSPLLLIIIFIVFAVIAAGIIYLTR